MKIVETTDRSAQEIMDLDLQLLEHLEELTLHFYRWRAPSATFGYFLDPQKIFNEGHGLDLGRRPTGGGVIFHLWDFAFSLLIPKGHPLYRTETMASYLAVHEEVRKALLPFGTLAPHVLDPDPLFKQFCMAHPTRYDLLFEGKKVGGAAQRRKKRGVLHQASLFISPPDPLWIERALKEGTRLARQIEKTSGWIPYSDLKERLAVVFKGPLA